MKYILYQANLLLISLISLVSFVSCSSNDAEKRVEIAKIIEGRNAKDLLNDLYIGSDGNVEALARMLGATPSSINRIRNGETKATEDFEKRIKDVSIYYSQNGQSFSKLRSTIDAEWKWYDSILNFPSHYPWIFWIGNALLIILGVIAGANQAEGVAVIIGIITIAQLILGLVAWIVSLLLSPDALVDSYIDTINPVIEQLL